MSYRLYMDKKSWSEPPDQRNSRFPLVQSAQRTVRRFYATKYKDAGMTLNKAEAFNWLRRSDAEAAAKDRQLPGLNLSFVVESVNDQTGETLLHDVMSPLVYVPGQWVSIDSPRPGSKTGRRAQVKAFFPDGSTSYAFPHVKVKEDGGEGYSGVLALDRVAHWDSYLAPRIVKAVEHAWPHVRSCGACQVLRTCWCCGKEELTQATRCVSGACLSCCGPKCGHTDAHPVVLRPSHD